MLEGAFLAEGARVVDASSILRRARLVKSPAEIRTIEKATTFAEVGIEALRREIRPGMTELSCSASSRPP